MTRRPSSAAIALCRPTFAPRSQTTVPPASASIDRTIPSLAWPAASRDRRSRTPPTQCRLGSSGGSPPSAGGCRAALRAGRADRGGARLAAAASPPASWRRCAAAWTWMWRPRPRLNRVRAGRSARREVQRDAVEVRSKKAAEADVAAGHQRERRQEVLAELAIGDPRSARLCRGDRERVDEDRTALGEQDVGRARVAEREAGGSRFGLDVERQEGRVAEHPERPLVGIRHELDLRRPDDGVGPGRVCGGFEGRGLMRTSRPSAWSRSSRPLATVRSQRSANERLIWRRRTPSRR